MPTFKNKLKFFLRNFGLDINRYNLIESNDFRLNHFLKINDIDCVLDVGANIGQYANNLRRIGYKKKIISFEPLSSAYEVIKKKSIKDKYWTVHNFGIGEQEKKVDINISKNSYSSSILDILPLHTESEPQSEYFSKETISIKKLENLNEIDIEKFNKVFIKIDTQGYEEQVLQGIGKLINKIEGIQIELSLYPLYKNQTLFLELYKKIKELGFDLWDFQRGFGDVNSGKIYQLDGIFFNNKK
jgi:FkbM family methyltransferase|tara:strand:+ start:212 stop:940 length:729 start_codon:yes stop_codon:yes gene_type:complete